MEALAAAENDDKDPEEEVGRSRAPFTEQALDQRPWPSRRWCSWCPSRVRQIGSAAVGLARRACPRAARRLLRGCSLPRALRRRRSWPRATLAGVIHVVSSCPLRSTSVLVGLEVRQVRH